MPDFAAATILVTGAAPGIGLAVAERLAADGTAKLVLVDLDGAALNRIDLPCSIETLPGSVAEEAFWDDVAPHLAGLTHAVVNAGVAGAGAIAELPFAEWRRILSVNLDGAFLTLRAALRAMSAGEKGGGAIVALSSATAVRAEAGTAAYGASKAALLQLVRVAAKEAAPRRIRINALAPAGVETPVWDGVPMFAARAAVIGRDVAFAELASMATPLGRYAKPAEVAAQVAWLLSGDAALITGATLLADGGYTL
ncbi:SDR family NAD(P)-dependent oxidoreductase [Sphingomonas sp.]|uniref:SDR family NAD(P)-dependent oxidoreductase n=1 Tax=Sphingomonas sp. TaxID=28214 RepID=UPI003CC5C997